MKLRFLVVFFLFLGTMSAHAGDGFVAKVSWYGGKFNGRPMRNGKIYDKNNRHIAAGCSEDLLGKQFLVVTNGRRLPVTVEDTMSDTDRKVTSEHRFLDLSEAGAQYLGIREKGVAAVTIYEIG